MLNLAAGLAFVFLLAVCWFVFNVPDNRQSVDHLTGKLDDIEREQQTVANSIDAIAERLEECRKEVDHASGRIQDGAGITSDSARRIEESERILQDIRNQQEKD